MPTVAKEFDDTPLDPKSLAGMMESDPIIRARLRYQEKGQLLRWLKNDQGHDIVGQLSMQTIALNVRPLTILAKYWCPKSKVKAKSPGINLIRSEARVQ